MICISCADAFDASLAVFLETDDPAGPHKARVCLRRFTIALDAFQPILRRKRSAVLRARAKRTFRELGLVRDSDVHLAAKTAEPGAKTRTALNRNLREKTREKLRKSRAVQFAPDLRMAVMEGGDIYRRSAEAAKNRRASTREFSAEVFSTAWERCSKYGASVSAIAADSRHNFRKDIKTLRYLYEFLEIMDDSFRDEAFRRDVREIQGALGLVNDFSVVASMDGRKLTSVLPDTLTLALATADAAWARLLARVRPWEGQATRNP